MSYLSQRKQQVEIGRSQSYWGNLSHGVPQGSILGPLIFNIFLNDVFYVLDKQCNLYNYAEDNTIHLDHLSKRTSRQLSAIRRIAKYLNKDCIMKLNDYKSNYDSLLQLSNLQALLISRFKAILYEVYKYTREINPSFMNELFSKIIHPYHTRSGSMLTQPGASSIK